jgi:hypothetical protein
MDLSFHLTADRRRRPGRRPSCGSNLVAGGELGGGGGDRGALVAELKVLGLPRRQTDGTS